MATIRKARILIVEDETDVLSLNVRYMKQLGYKVFAAKTLAEARASTWEYPPDLILLDVLLPDGSGYDFCTEIRRSTTAPIIYLTCMSGQDDIVLGLCQGGDDYITKPYSLDVLAARVMAALRRSGFGASGHIEMPPLTIDLSTGKAALSGQDIPLSHKELLLLAFLASNAGRAFSAQELYAQVWGGAPGVKTNTVRVYISNLRSKLKLDDSSVFELSLTPDRRYMFQKVRFEAEA